MAGFLMVEWWACNEILGQRNSLNRNSVGGCRRASAPPEGIFAVLRAPQRNRSVYGKGSVGAKLIYILDLANLLKFHLVHLVHAIPGIFCFRQP